QLARAAKGRPERRLLALVAQRATADRGAGRADALAGGAVAGHAQLPVQPLALGHVAGRQGRGRRQQREQEQDREPPGHDPRQWTLTIAPMPESRTIVRNRRWATTAAMAKNRIRPGGGASS